MTSAEQPGVLRREAIAAGFDLYGVFRQIARRAGDGGWRAGGWDVIMMRHRVKVRRLFKDTIFGSADAALSEAMAYRDALVENLIPMTNGQMAVNRRTDNISGVPGVSRGIDRRGPYWCAVAAIAGRQKQARFHVSKYGEDEAKALAVAARQSLLAQLPPTFLVRNAGAKDVATRSFAEQLNWPADILQLQLTMREQIIAKLAEIDAMFDARRPTYRPGRIRGRYTTGEVVPNHHVVKPPEDRASEG